nr:hypothetical protein 15 [bacterium]
MPLLYFAIGGAGGFWAAKGAEEITDLVKWAAIAGGVYLTAKKMKVLQ